jgi:hypothetical protein
VPANANAADTSVVFTGGSDTARAQVVAALQGSIFDWSLVGQVVTVEIRDCGCAGARPGAVVLDETMLGSQPYGRAYTWGIVQHELAHQVWWFALDDEQRRELKGVLGGSDLCYEQPGLPHDAHACERFASTLAWAYWPVAGNPAEPEKAIGGRAFRLLLGGMLGFRADFRRVAALRRGP